MKNAAVIALFIDSSIHLILTTSSIHILYAIVYILWVQAIISTLHIVQLNSESLSAGILRLLRIERKRDFFSLCLFIWPWTNKLKKRQFMPHLLLIFAEVNVNKILHSCIHQIAHRKVWKWDKWKLYFWRRTECMGNHEYVDTHSCYLEITEEVRADVWNKLNDLNAHSDAIKWCTFKLCGALCTQFTCGIWKMYIFITS